MSFLTMERTSSRPQRRRSLKARRTYREPDSDTDFDLESISSSKRPARASRRQLQTYREPATSEDDTQSTSVESASEPEFRFAVTSTAHRNINARTRPARTRVSTRRSQRNVSTLSSATTHGHISNSFKKQKTSHYRSKDDKILKDAGADEAVMSINTDAPPWQTLEYRILVRIMQYASYPLYVGASRQSSSVQWLVDLSRLCRSFHDAAMTALLWDPPLLPPYRVQGLLKTLSHKPEDCMINYRSKIRSLSIEVRSLGQKSVIKLGSLFKVTPLLSHLRIFHVQDELIGKVIWAEPTVGHFKWSYDDLFDDLDQNSIRLQSFEWNGRFQDTLHAMSVAHHRPCMVGLEAISIINLNFTDKQVNECINARDQVMSSLSILSRLKEVEFRNCTFLSPEAMVRLPLGLWSLKIVNSLSLTSEGVAAFLSKAGHELRELHLEGNQVMDLGFMPKLSETCPRLEMLDVDLSYEDCSSYRDRNPLYDELLPNGCPTWPESLVSIVIGPLRSLGVADAQGFYTSLINAANHLPYLRTLSIKTLLTDASWRDRASLRTKWQSIFEKVFAADKSYVPIITRPRPKKSKPSQRKSARLQELEDVSPSEEGDHGSDVTMPDGSPLPRQNRCEIVEFELSDQRPAQEQFRETDFIDSEPSDDDEWDGRDQAAPGHGYAW